MYLGTTIFVKNSGFLGTKTGNFTGSFIRKGKVGMIFQEFNILRKVCFDNLGGRGGREAKSGIIGATKRKPLLH